MGRIIFSYRIAYDMGFAPCIDNNIFTLACCKGGQIRNGKNIITGLRYHVGQHYYRNPVDEIYLFGIYKNDIFYYARITDAITMGEYISMRGKAYMETERTGQECPLCISFEDFYYGNA